MGQSRREMKRPIRSCADDFRVKTAKARHTRCISFRVCSFLSSPALLKNATRYDTDRLPAAPELPTANTVIGQQCRVHRPEKRLLTSRAQVELQLPPLIPTVCCGKSNTILRQPNVVFDTCIPPNPRPTCFAGPPSSSPSSCSSSSCSIHSRASPRHQSSRVARLTLCLTPRSDPNAAMSPTTPAEKGRRHDVV